MSRTLSLIVLAASAAIACPPPTQTNCCGGGALCFARPAKDEEVFPDSPTPGAPRRDHVDVVVQVCPAAAARMVHLRAIDVDDPSSDTEPVDANGPAGDDNRGVPQRGSLAGADASGVATLTTDDAGRVHAVFQLTLQPGDNFALQASFEPGFEQPVTSPTLTVWRELHVELDDMGWVTGNEIRARILGSEQVSTGPLRSRVKLDRRISDDSRPPGRYQGGKLMTSTHGSFPIVESDGDRIVVDGLVANAPDECSLVDDDLLTGDIPAVDASRMEATYAAAFIRPVFEDAQTTRNVPFDLNTSMSEQVPVIRAGKGLASGDAGYWAVTVQQGFQLEAEKDNDGDDETTYRARAWRCEHAVFLASESIRDWIAAPVALGGAGGAERCPTCTNTRNQDILHHEVGHLLGLEHPDGARTPAEPNGGLMAPSCCGPTTRASSSFSQVSLAKLRSLTALPSWPCP
jgi:hypothetical protein